MALLPAHPRTPCHYIYTVLEVLELHSPTFPPKALHTTQVHHELCPLQKLSESHSLEDEPVPSNEPQSPIHSLGGVSHGHFHQSDKVEINLPTRCSV